MSHFSFCHVPLILLGHASPVHDAVAEMFALSQPLTGDNPVTIRTFAVSRDESLDMIPAQLRQELSQLHPSNEAIMRHGPDGDILAATVQVDSMSCAWLAGDGHEIRFIAQKNKADKTGLSVGGCLVAILREIMSRKEKTLLHSAALRCPDGTGLLLSADGGGGKSTTSLALVRQGATLLSDDLVALTKQPEGNPTMTGFPELMNVTEQTMQFFPELRRGAATSNAPASCMPHHKSQVNPGAAYQDWVWLDTATLDVCCYLHIDKAGPFTTELSPNDFLGRLIRSHTFANGQKISRHSAEILLKISTTIPAYILHTGSDPAELGRWLAAHCAALAKRTAAPDQNTGEGNV